MLPVFDLLLAIREARFNVLSRQMASRFNYETLRVNGNVISWRDTHALIELPIALGPKKRCAQDVGYLISANSSNIVSTKTAQPRKLREDVIIGCRWRHIRNYFFTRQSAPLEEFAEAMCADI